MSSLRQYIREIPDFPQPGILFRDITPLLREHFDATLAHMSELVSAAEWSRIDAVAGIEARGFILAAALAARHGKGFVPIRKEGKLPPPVVRAAYALEYGTSAVEMRQGTGNLLIVDDVLATGGTITASADLAIEAGYGVTALVSLIDLNLVKGFSWKEHAVRAVVKY